MVGLHPLEVGVEPGVLELAVVIGDLLIAIITNPLRSVLVYVQGALLVTAVRAEDMTTRPGSIADERSAGEPERQHRQWWRRLSRPNFSEQE